MIHSPKYNGVTSVMYHRILGELIDVACSGNVEKTAKMFDYAIKVIASDDPVIAFPELLNKAWGKLPPDTDLVEEHTKNEG